MHHQHRLDAVIPFAALGKETIGRVVEKFILQLENQLSDRSVTIRLTEAARNELGEQGYDRMMGARPLARVIQDKIKKMLAEELLFGRLQNGGSVLIGWSGSDFEFTFPSAAIEEVAKLPAPDGAEDEESVS